MKKETTDRGDLVPAEIVDNDSLEVIAGQLVEAARADGVALTGDGGLLPALLSRVLSAGLEAELGDHLGYEPHASDGRNSGNSRNGVYQRRVTTEVGPVEVTMPRDRNATFDPKLVPKGTAAPTTVSSYVKRFERRGHITRTPNAEDGRSYRLELSAAGRDAHRHAGELFAPVLTQTDERLGAHAQTVREQLLKLLRAVDTIRDEHR